jgi:hypothetical protein
MAAKIESLKGIPVNAFLMAGCTVVQAGGNPSTWPMPILRMNPAPHDAPVGIFDSGVGGLSVLRHIRAQLPHEHLIYFADSGFAPYGDKPEHVVAERVAGDRRFLVAQGAKALVVACNTATVAAIG